MGQTIVMFRAMDGQTDAIPPIWRTSLAPVLLAWMALVVAATLASWRLAEMIPHAMAVPLILGLCALPPVGLLVWSFWNMLREPVTGWLGPTVLLTFCGAMVPAFLPLIAAGAQLNFQAHRPAYDAIVADVAAGRLMGAADGEGWMAGSRDGIRFRYPPARKGVIEFEWTRDSLLEAGVRYDDKPCRPSRALKCVDPGEHLDGNYYHYVLMF